MDKISDFILRAEKVDRRWIFLIIGLLLFLAEFIIPTRTKKEMVWEGRFTRNG